MRTKTGIITSNKMQGTVTVKVTEYLKHSKYNKETPVSKKFHAHTDVPLEEGITVTIEETKPRSKTVCWKVVLDQAA
ncbi:mitochondrial small ribosomal subunit protein uS17m [Candidatus Gracilibacteria bacterium]|mgnify:CR=1 FL=1|nr:mitochondrial small ribosomal subunit protein uS17m [Candidatus Gracilibacteria bacterium]